jgi:hypothetical protein
VIWLYWLRFVELILLGAVVAGLAWLAASADA